MATNCSDEVQLASLELCDPCFSNCKEILAVLYCLDCDEKFCEVCGTCHAKSKLSKDHKLSKVAEAPSGNVVKLLKKLTTCPNHKSEEVVYICIDEDQLCCNQCANTSHRACRQLETIEQYMTTAIHNETITHQMTNVPNVAIAIEVQARPRKKISKKILPEGTVLENLTEMERQLAEILKQDANERSIVADSASRVTAYLQAVQAKLESAFNSLKIAVMSQCEMQTRIPLQNIDMRQTTITNLRDRISTNRDNIDSINRHGNDKHVFLLRREVTNDIQDIESRIRELNQRKAASKIEVVEQTTVDNIVRTITGALRVQPCGGGAYLISRKKGYKQEYEYDS
ncbi:E3 ubiquitin-protein ligase TRIM33-like [Dreissena polymorpha]|uniref:B box-type domain-containing protein n=1 Tax=Dreissena polymorpha TaxID=45954 RepID=A0A9D4BQ12_DREPO|nr:E3 ubiquitin-protein ligase TRIM33-like [Dreissena polymorpha]XP_052254784.1 E3 ubiquitin-protein ligase TRIM33-like [Dreissena polymorpha]KAH3700997.1 hypothetical protein DPMN_075980 [Dreissena polymorpha]